MFFSTHILWTLFQSFSRYCKRFLIVPANLVWAKQPLISVHVWICDFSLEQTCKDSIREIQLVSYTASQSTGASETTGCSKHRSHMNPQLLWVPGLWPKNNSGVRLHCRRFSADSTSRPLLSPYQTPHQPFRGCT